jgi:nitrogen fixation protein NifT
MKVMLHRNESGNLSVYVAKKDLEEEVVNDTMNDGARILTLANGWELEFSGSRRTSGITPNIKSQKTLIEC